ncbi:unnamed protein product [Amoebophrya sp. A120]|nr:unnamed protein product [Amoebophrya sp. A120]|eukprot:GSA120T00023172001.1
MPEVQPLPNTTPDTSRESPLVINWNEKTKSWSCQCRTTNQSWLEISSKTATWKGSFGDVYVAVHKRFGKVALKQCLLSGKNNGNTNNNVTGGGSSSSTAAKNYLQTGSSSTTTTTSQLPPQPDIQMSEEQLLTFQRELYAFHAIEETRKQRQGNPHANLVQYFGTLLPEATANTSALGLLIELVDGNNLYELSTNGQYKFSNSARVAHSHQLASALLHLHGAVRLVHRDVKPQNCVVSHRPTDLPIYGFPYMQNTNLADGNYYNALKVCDFGKTLELMPPRRTSAMLTTSGTTSSPSLVQTSTSSSAPAPLYTAFIKENGGSPRYMPREAFQQNSFITERVDSYAFGCFLLEIFTQKVPFPDVQNLHEITQMITGRMGATPPIPVAQIPGSLLPLLQQCFRLRPEDRPCMAEAVYWIKARWTEMVSSAPVVLGS